MTGKSRYVFTGSVVLLTVVIVLIKYWDEIENPWTRDGQVAAQVVLIAPRVSGPIVDLPIKDDQFVKQGELLFEIDSSIFEAKLKYAQAALAKTESDLAALDQQIEIGKSQVDSSMSNIKEAQTVLDQAKAVYDDSLKDFTRKTALLKSDVIAKKEYDNSKAAYEVSEAKLKDAQAELQKAKFQLAEAKSSLKKADANRGLQGEHNAELRLAKAKLELAELELSYTKVTAPVDGYISNLQLRKGSQMIPDKPVVALIDVDSYWVYGFFQEDEVQNMNPKDQAIVTLMGYPDKPINGEVISIGWGIAQEDGSLGNNLLMNVKPTFEWIRLAQRVPVRVKLKDVPKGIKLRVGTTASVLVRTNQK